MPNQTPYLMIVDMLPGSYFITPNPMRDILSIFLYFFPELPSKSLDMGC